MKKGIISILLILVFAMFIACEEESVTEADYISRTFEADMGYDSEAEYGSVSYTHQTYFKFNDDEMVDTASYGTADWTDFNVYTASENYNVTTEVTGWDLVFTYYTQLETGMGQSMEYGVTGVLIDTTAVTGVAVFDYDQSTDADSISTAFYNLVLSDVDTLTYSNDIAVIGNDWKTFDFTNYLYSLHTEWFYIVKLVSGDIYKLRFVSFYGTSTDERIIKIEYMLMY